MRVELDALSGRPNPKWELTQPESVKLLTLLKGLEPIEGAAAVFDGLGYRGFVLEAPAGEMSGFDQVRVFHGTVHARRGGGTLVFHDGHHALETWLLETGRSHVDEGILEYVRKEIGLP